MLGLLDSGASRTIIGAKGWSILKEMGLNAQNSKIKNCTVADGKSCEVLGSIHLPIKLQEKLKIMEVLIMPSLPHTLILGADFWRIMAIVPDLRHGEWKFSSSEQHIDLVASLKPQTELSDDQKHELDSVVDKLFQDLPEGLGCTHLVEHKITTTSPPIKQRNYPVSPVIQQHIDGEIDQMLADGVIEPSKSPWSSPIILVKKKNNTYRFCIDYRKLNQVSIPDAYPLPYISSILDKLRNANYLSSVDIKSAFWQVPMEENSKQYTAFSTSRGLFQFRRMPFGLHSSPATFQRLVDTVLGVELEPFVFVYLDDIIILTPTFEKHLEILEEVFNRLKNAGLRLGRDKCQFCRPELKYLGYVVDNNGLHVDPDKISAILEIPTPRNVKEVRRILGMTSWYRRFVKNFSSLVTPLTNLLRKNKPFIWTSECDDSFKKIKEALVSAPVLGCPDFSLPFTIYTDASGYGVGAVLTQQHEDGEQAIAYISRSLNKNERNFTTTERECLAVIYAIERFRAYVEGAKFTVVTDHYSLKWLKELKSPTGRLARWSLRLQQYDYEVIHRKGSEMALPDALSRAVPVIDEVQSDKIDNFDTKDKWYRKLKDKIAEHPLNYSQWRTHNGKIWKYVKAPYPALSTENEWKEVVPKELRKNIIEENHCPPTCGHAGIYKTYDRLCQRYYWPKMKQDVTNFVRKCEICIQVKVEQKGPAGLNTGTTTSSIAKPWEAISCDLMGPFPRSSKGNCYIFVVVDLFSKFVVMVPLRSATSTAVTKFLEDNVILMFGTPKFIICDNGVQFKSKEFTNCVRDYGSKILYTPNYTPRCNPTERVNRVLKTMLCCYVGNNHRHWDKDLQKIACAIRTAKHESTQLTPYFINFGREIEIKGKETNTDTNEVPEIDVEKRNESENRSKSFGQVFADVKKRLKVAYEKSKHTYNLRRRPVELHPGQLVWKRNYILSDATKYFTAKLAPKYVGPFKVHAKAFGGAYEIVDMDGKSRGIWNVKDLKLHPIEDLEDDSV